MYVLHFNLSLIIRYIRASANVAVEALCFASFLLVTVPVASLGGGRTAPGDTIQGMTPDVRKIVWLNLERTVGKRGRTGKKVFLQTAMTKKRSSAFSGKGGDTRQLPPRVTPTLVAPPRRPSVVRPYL